MIGVPFMTKCRLCGIARRIKLRWDAETKLGAQ
jgi:hypothetical protein